MQHTWKNYERKTYLNRAQVADMGFHLYQQVADLFTLFTCWQRPCSPTYVWKQPIQAIRQIWVYHSWCCWYCHWVVDWSGCTVSCTCHLMCTIEMEWKPFGSREHCAKRAQLIFYVRCILKYNAGRWWPAPLLMAESQMRMCWGPDRSRFIIPHRPSITSGRRWAGWKPQTLLRVLHSVQHVLQRASCKAVIYSVCAGPVTTCWGDIWVKTENRRRL